MKQIQQHLFTLPKKIRPHSLPFGMVVVETTSTHSGQPGVPSPIQEDTDSIIYRIEARRGEVGFNSEGVE
jgi:hypothetical protein